MTEQCEMQDWEQQGEEQEPESSAQPFRRLDTAGRRELLRRAVARGGPSALSKIPPLAIAARLDSEYTSDDPATLLTPCVDISLVVNPLLDAVLVELGFQRRGVRTYAIGLGENTDREALRAALAAVDPVTLFPGSLADVIQDGGVANVSGWQRRTMLEQSLRHLVGPDSLDDAVGFQPTYNLPSAGAAVLVTVTDRQLYLRICTSPYYARDGLALPYMAGQYAPGVPLYVKEHNKTTPDMNLMPPSATKPSLRVHPDIALATLENFAAAGVAAVDEDGGVASLRERLRTTVVARSIPGSPGLTYIAGGHRNLQHSDWDAEQISNTVWSCEMPVLEAERLMGKIDRRKKGQTIRCPRVADAQAMSTATPADIVHLRPYQREAAALHTTTSIGMLNVFAPGLGKTPTTLAGFRARALGVDGRKRPIKAWRGLVVCPASVRLQWERETQRFFPEAEVRVLHASDLTDTLKQAHRDAGRRPLVVIVNDATARRCLDDLCQYRWHDLCCDEATMLKNTGSERAKALWRLRECADVAVALTGTPIEQNLDDLGKIASWALADRALFQGKRLTRRFDTATTEGVAELWQALGPYVIRRDRSEIATELPAVLTETIVLEPSPQELALANGARTRLREIYADLERKVQTARELDPDDPELLEVEEELKRSRGAVLGGITLARMAAADPHAVAESDSAAAVLLDDAGLIKPATRTHGTKREEIVNIISDMTGRGEACLIFTDFSSVAQNLIDDLKTRGVRVGGISGAHTERARDLAARGFQGTPCATHQQTETAAVAGCPDCVAPTLDCLVLTSAAREGLNLQRCSVLVHFDLPWLPGQMVQRVGRAARFGSRNKTLTVIVPLMAGTIEERVAAVLLPRAMQAAQVLDAARGIDLKDSEIGSAVSGIAQHIDAVEVDKRHQSLFALAREVLV